MLYPEEVKVLGIDAQLTVSAAEILLKRRHPGAFLEDDRDESVRMLGKRRLRVFRNAIIHRETWKLSLTATRDFPKRLWAI